MKKVILLVMSALLVTGVTFAGEGGKKKCGKGKHCCHKASCNKEKTKSAS